VQRGSEHEARLRRLLDGAQPPNQSEPPDALEHPAQPLGRFRLRRSGQGRDDRLPRLHLAQIDESGLGAERLADERRARAWGADDEHEPLLGPAAMPARHRARRATAVQRGRFDEPADTGGGTFHGP